MKRILEVPRHFIASVGAKVLPTSFKSNGARLVASAKITSGNVLGVSLGGQELSR